MPEKSKSIATIANITTTIAITSNKTPEYVSDTATARNPPKIAYNAPMMAKAVATYMSGRSRLNMLIMNKEPE